MNLGLAFYLFSPTVLINSVKHEHSCKILCLLGQMGCLVALLFDPLLLKVTALLQQIFSAGPVGVELGSLAVLNVVVVKAVPGSL